MRGGEDDKDKRQGREAGEEEMDERWGEEEKDERRGQRGMYTREEGEYIV